jgi:hypothetical protein
MKITEAIKIVEEELVKSKIIPIERSETEWYAKWNLKNGFLYLNRYKGFYWNEDNGVVPYYGYAVTVERYDVRSEVTLVVFYSDIENFNAAIAKSLI